MVEIVTKEDLERIDQALKDVAGIKRELAKAKRAGIDVAALEARLQEAELALRNIQRVYGTKTP